MLARSLTNRDAALPAESLKALDWLNFFLAAFLMGFGPFVAASDTDGHLQASDRRKIGFHRLNWGRFPNQDTAKSGLGHCGSDSTGQVG